MVQKFSGSADSLSNDAPAECPSTENPVKTILHFLKNNDSEIVFGDNKNIVLLFGITGAGKSTIGQIITTDMSGLKSIETYEDSGEYLIVDENDKISRNQTITSKTIIPEQFVNSATSTSYFDCPGFEDSRSVKYDIGTTYFIRKVLNFAESVKFVFVVNHASLRQGGDRLDFIKMVKHATNLIRNVDKFQDGIGLVATKVDNQYTHASGVPVLVGDDTVIKSIARFLEGAKQELQSKRAQSNVSPDECKFIGHAIKFVDILLKKKGNGYRNIRIVRRPAEGGQLQKISSFQHAKRAIEQMIDKDMQFVAKEVDDFGFTISAESQNQITDLIEYIRNDVIDDLLAIGNDIERSLEEHEFHLGGDLVGKFSMAMQILTAIVADNPRQFFDGVLKASKALAAQLNVNISSEKLNNFDENTAYLEFLSKLKHQKAPKTFSLLNVLQKITQRLEASRRWYNFLNNLYDVLSSYEVQKNVGNYDATALIRQCSGVNVASDEFGLKEFLNSIQQPSLYLQIENTKVNPHKLKALKAILNFTMIESKEITQPSEDVLRATGNFIKISDIANYEYRQPIKYLEIFALDKVFIDANLDKTGEQMQISIVAPKWEIIGAPQIIVSGKDGKVHDRATAEKGEKPGDSGKDGMPGVSGTSAGHFIGIGSDVKNGKRLAIYANGGKGSDGQNGGEGYGMEGVNPPDFKSKNLDDWIKIADFYRKRGFSVKSDPDANKGFWRYIGKGWQCGHVFLSGFKKTDESKPTAGDFWSYDIIKVYGKEAIPADGGNGGAGGNGGCAGEISLIWQKPNEPEFKTERMNGQPGRNGVGAYGTQPMPHGRIRTFDYAFSGTNGKIRHSKIDSKIQRDDICDFLFSKTQCAAGKKGKDGKYEKIEPKPVDFQHSIHPIRDYKNFAENRLSSITQSDLRKFLGDPAFSTTDSDSSSGQTSADAKSESSFDTASSMTGLTSSQASHQEQEPKSVTSDIKSQIRSSFDYFVKNIVDVIAARPSNGMFK